MLVWAILNDNDLMETKMSDAPRRRSGGRAGNTRGNRGAIEQMPWRIIENTDRPIEPLTDEGILAIHDLFADPFEGGQAPYAIFNMAMQSGLFERIEQINSLGLLRRL